MLKKSVLTISLGILLGLTALQSWALSEAIEVIPDTAITTAVKAKMLEDKLLSALDIQVKTNKGVVVLSGNVKSSSEANAAIELASSTLGVVGVETKHLLIQGSHHPLVDSVITAKIKGIYLREKILGDKPMTVVGVHVETSEGVVYLTGEVDNLSQAELVVKLASSVSGVKRVKSNVSVKNN